MINPHGIHTILVFLQFFQSPEEKKDPQYPLPQEDTVKIKKLQNKLGLSTTNIRLHMRMKFPLLSYKTWQKEGNSGGDRDA